MKESNPLERLMPYRWYNFMWNCLGMISNKMGYSILFVYPVGSKVFFPNELKFSWIFWLVIGASYLINFLYVFCIVKAMDRRRIKERYANQFLNTLSSIAMLGYVLIPSFNEIGFLSTIAISVCFMVQTISFCGDYPLIFTSTVKSFPASQRVSIAIFFSLLESAITALSVYLTKFISLRELSALIFFVSLISLVVKRNFLMDKVHFFNPRTSNSQSVVASLKRLGKCDLIYTVLPSMIFIRVFEVIVGKWWMEVTNSSKVFVNILTVSSLIKVMLLLHPQNPLKNLKLNKRTFIFTCLYTMLAVPMLFYLSGIGWGLLGQLINLPIRIVFCTNILFYLEENTADNLCPTDLSYIFTLLTSIISPIVTILPSIFHYNCSNLFPRLGEFTNVSLFMAIVCISGAALAKCSCNKEKDISKRALK